MKIRIVVPLAIDVFNNIALDEALLFKAPDTDIEVVNLDGGYDRIDVYSNEKTITYTLPFIVDKVMEAEKEGCDGVFISWFGDPAVDASRVAVNIPVVGGFEPAVHMASLISTRWSIISPTPGTVSTFRMLARKHGLEENIASMLTVNVPLTDERGIEEKVLPLVEKAVDEDGAEAVVLGCTGFGRLASNLARQMKIKGKPITVINPSAAAIGFLESLIRSGLSQSRVTYPESLL
jgi:allantoin racemase